MKTNSGNTQLRAKMLLMAMTFAWMNEKKSFSNFMLISNTTRWLTQRYTNKKNTVLEKAAYLIMMIKIMRATTKKTITPTREYATTAMDLAATKKDSVRKIIYFYSMFYVCLYVKTRNKKCTRYFYMYIQCINSSYV